MIDRVAQENRELEILSEFATKSVHAKRSLREDEKCEFRTEFQRDKDRIIHSKSFRRLMHKTQVFLASDKDHYRTRLTHTLEVSQIARTIARALALNEDLTEAIALGHDLGHTPFGHSGEDVLNKVHPGGFRHNEQSVWVVDVLEFSGGLRGMNLTEEVRDGILNHTGKLKASTPEGQIIKFSDRIAYINHDIDDALRAGVIKKTDLPKTAIEILGDSHSKRINNLIIDVVKNSQGKPDMAMSPEIWAQMDTLRNFMFENVYHSSQVKRVESLNEVDEAIHFFYEYYLKNSEQLPPEMFEMTKEFGVNTVVKDFIAGMTDRYAMSLYHELQKK